MIQEKNGERQLKYMQGGREPNATPVVPGNITGVAFVQKSAPKGGLFEMKVKLKLGKKLEITISIDKAIVFAILMLF